MSVRKADRQVSKAEFVNKAYNLAIVSKLNKTKKSKKD
jgi:hypothetical protein|nr:MAG TPA: hypothetical protein [Bacteriophage sp.]